MLQTLGAWKNEHGTIRIQQGNIVKSDAMVIVNAANPQLKGGGGVDGAIHMAAGPGLVTAGMEWVAQNGPLPTGKAVITPSFDLKALFVIHTVGPVWQGGNADEDALLASCYRESMRMARALGMESIAFPAISCGAYGFPVERATGIALKTLAESLNEGVVKSISMVIFSPETAAVWVAKARELFE